jgi:hypothetical protein
MKNAVPVTNGFFLVTLDFDSVWSGDARWLAISVKTNGAALYTPLDPRQPMTPTPYAIMALSTGNLLGLQTGAVTSTVSGILKIDWDNNSNSNNAFIGDKLMVSVIDSATGETFLSGTDISRSAGTANITLPTEWSGRNVEVHAFFVKNVERVTSKDYVSESEYLGNVDVA